MTRKLNELEESFEIRPREELAKRLGDDWVILCSIYVDLKFREKRGKDLFARLTIHDIYCLKISQEAFCYSKIVGAYLQNIEALNGTVYHGENSLMTRASRIELSQSNCNSFSLTPNDTILHRR